MGCARRFVFLMKRSMASHSRLLDGISESFGGQLMLERLAALLKSSRQNGCSGQWNKKWYTDSTSNVQAHIGEAATPILARN